jgi:hypothetical protein
MIDDPVLFTTLVRFYAFRPYPLCDGSPWREFESIMFFLAFLLF